MNAKSKTGSDPTMQKNLFTCVFILISLVGPSPSLLFAEEVPWLAEVTKVPDSVSKPEKPLQDLLANSFVNDNAQHIESWEAWQRKRAQLIEVWKSDLGVMPDRPVDIGFIVKSTEALNWGSRELIEYECEQGIRVQAYLLRPLQSENNQIENKSRAGILALHPTTSLTIDAIAGVSGEPKQHTAVALVERGFVVLCPRCFLWQDAKNYDDAVQKHRKRHPGVTGMAKMLYDAQRALDILASLPGVDPKRLGAFGHSLGAKEVLYLMAFDERIRAGVASEGGVALESTNWNAPWYLGDLATDPSWERNHHELLAFTVPRPLLIIGGESGQGAADGTRSWPLIQSAHAVSILSKFPIRLGLLNHGLGHPLPRKELEKGIEWLTTYTSP